MNTLPGMPKPPPAPPAPPPPITLGQRVTFTETLKRLSRVAAPRHTRTWDSSPMWSIVTSRGPALGIVVGLRNLSDGEVELGYYDEPTVYFPRRTFAAYLVAYDLRRKPVLVLPEHMEAIQ